MFKWLFNKPVEVKTPQPKAKTSLFSTHEFDFPAKRFDLVERVFQLKREQPIFHGDYAQDDSSDGFPQFKTYNAMANTVSDAVVGWYATQGFIGAQLCGILAQNWLINKACAMPGDDAIRKGYNIVSIDGDELPPEAIKIMKRYDRSMRLTWNMREFIRKGRIFGIRVAMFKVMSTDPDYYEKPFNIDGVTPGSYKGIVQVDPYWTAPMLDGAAASQPDTLHFYEPTWWIINGKKIHRSHLIIFRHAEPVDVLKPSYIYGGVPLSQQIMERVYAAERTANEAPQLAMTKRTTVWLTDMEAVMANSDAAIERLQQWAQYRDNFGVKLGDKEGDEFSQFDTSLADMDALIMTQYQLVAAIAGVPSTKLIGTSPKGFNASGEYEEASYHELLESIQTHDLTPLAERHHQLVMKSFVESQLKLKLNIQTTLNWLPLDTPTAAELAATNLTKAQTSQILIQSGALSSEDERQRIATDKDSGYNELGILDENPDNFEDGEPDEETPDQPEKEDDKPVPKEIVKAEDADVKFEEKKHPRADNGQFGSGGGGAKTEVAKGKKKETIAQSPSAAPSREAKQAGSSQGSATQKVKKLSNGGYIDKQGFERSPNLTPKERKVESTFYAAIKANEKALVDKYSQDFGNVIDPDSVKKLDPSFFKDTTLAGAVHEPSSYLSKVIWKAALEKKAAANDTSPTLFTAGGSGSGKSEAMDMAMDILGAKPDGLIFDSVLGNFKSSTEKIDQAVNITKGKIDIVYTNTSLSLAVQLNMSRKRTIKLDTLIDAHMKASENIKALTNHYKNNKRVNITIVNNGGYPPFLEQGEIGNVPTYTDRETIKKKLIEHAKQLVSSGVVKDGESKLKMLLS